MNKFIFLAIGATAFASPSAAQSGPVAQQSSKQLICNLSGDCEADLTSTQDGPKTRGFAIARPKQTPSNAIYDPPPRGGRKPTPPQNSLSAVAHPSTARPGRADLMISFVTGSAILTEQAKANAQEFVKALSTPKLARMVFTIEGHTDAFGNRAYNLDLSQRRAESVVDFLAANGANRSRFTTRGYGFDKPLNPRNTRDGANRRVEVVKAN